MDLLSSAQFLLSFCSVLLSRGVAHGSTLSGNFFLSRCFCAAILVGTCGCIFATSQHGSKQKHHSTDKKKKLFLVAGEFGMELTGGDNFLCFCMCACPLPIILW